MHIVMRKEVNLKVLCQSYQCLHTLDTIFVMQISCRSRFYFRFIINVLFISDGSWSHTNINLPFEILQMMGILSKTNVEFAPTINLVHKYYDKSVYKLVQLATQLQTHFLPYYNNSLVWTDSGNFK